MEFFGFVPGWWTPIYLSWLRPHLVYKFSFFLINLKKQFMFLIGFQILSSEEMLNSQKYMWTDLQKFSTSLSNSSLFSVLFQPK